MKRSEIKIIGCQIKSIESFRKLAKSLDEIEKNVGIKQVTITLEDNFICQDVEQSISKSNFGNTPMERCLLEILGWN